MRIKAQLMDEGGIRRALIRISHEILEKNKGAEDICIIGIRRRGELLAKQLADNIRHIENVDVPCGDIDIKFYRDDLTKISDQPIVRHASLPFSIVNKRIILVDDVLYTGRTVRAAIEAIFSIGRPRNIELAVLIDRGHRELPIRTDFVGKSIPTSQEETIAVLLPPLDDKAGVFICEKEV